MVSKIWSQNRYVSILHVHHTLSGYNSLRLQMFSSTIYRRDPRGTKLDIAQGGLSVTWHFTDIYHQFHRYATFEYINTPQAICNINSLFLIITHLKLSRKSVSCCTTHLRSASGHGELFLKGILFWGMKINGSAVKAAVYQRFKTVSSRLTDNRTWSPCC